MLKKTNFLMVLLVSSLAIGVFLFSSYFRESNKGLTLHTEYGDFAVNEPVIVELINDPYFQRLKDIRQYGTRHQVIKKEEYNRFEHCVGVFALLRRFGAPLNEQIAGLLHDVSHTVFSHVGDSLFKVSPLGDSYQDKIHEEFINKTSLANVLQKNNVSVHDIIHKNDSFTALEQPLPDLCADRLEYNLKGGLVEGLLTQRDVETILEDILYENGKWVFKNAESAKKLAMVPLYLTEHIFGVEAIIINELTADVLERALEIKLLTYDDIQYSTDDIVWNKIVASNDQEIQNRLEHLLNYQNYVERITDDRPYHNQKKAKFRGIDPLVKTEHAIVRLSALDSEFFKEYHTVKNRMNEGWKVKYLTSTSVKAQSVTA